MPTPITSPKTSKSTKSVIVAVFITALVVGVSVYFWTTKERPAIQNTQIQETKPANTRAYLMNRYNGEYSIFDLETGEQTSFMPAGYEIINQYEYDTFPEFLILRKDRDLFSYDVKNALVNKIFTADDLLLKDHEEVQVKTSITEKNKFLLIISEYDPNEIIEFGGPTPIHTRSYFFDASANSFTSADNIPRGCNKYDSKNQRFFTWLCSEGIGHSIPLSITDLNGKNEKEILSFSDFGLENPAYGEIDFEYNDGMFFAMPKGCSGDKLITVNPLPSKPQKETYTITADVQAHIRNQVDPHLYSITQAANQQTFAFGGSSSLILLRYTGNQITESKIIPARERSVDFLLPYENILYYGYHLPGELHALDLNTWLLKKSVPIKLTGQVTFIALPE